ncbi:MAG TPA: tetratricopeptide repeat protein [Verrucomicrobiae bacterium]|nr:tetratricopeptide repeat protein [Verrucomicrobiae bacterium]
MEEKPKTAREFCESQRWPDLLAFAEKWSEEVPADHRAWYYVGIALAGLGRFDEAEAAYRRALAIDPGEVKAWNNLAGLLYENLQRPLDGIRCLQQALKINPANKLAWSNLATMVGRMGHHDRAMEFANRALALDPELVEAHLHKGAAALALGKTDVVRDVCERLGRIAPEKFRRVR